MNTTEPPPGSKLSLADIAATAYELFREKGLVHGRDKEHWSWSEKELRKAAHEPAVPKRTARKLRGAVKAARTSKASHASKKAARSGG